MANGRRKYSAVPVKGVDVARVLKEVGTACTLAVDVARSRMQAGFADTEGKVVAGFRWSHPGETRDVLGMLRRLEEGGCEVKAAMEPTGTYGDALRHQLEAAGVPVYRVSANQSHYAAIVYDGVYSWHDGKSVSVIAMLHAQGRSVRWEATAASSRDLAGLVEQREGYDLTQSQYRNRMEAKLARFWPELMDRWECASVVAMLAKYGSAAAVGSNASAVRKQLGRTSRGLLGPDKIEAIVTSAAVTLGEPMSPGEVEVVRQYALELLRVRKLIKALDRRLAVLVQQSESGPRLAKTVGVAATAGLLASARDPRDYASAKAFEKSLGLNLRVRSSGEHQGKLKITKQGPTAPRRLLFMAALRLIQDDRVVRAWYAKRRGDEGTRLKAVVAVERKLARALWHVARGQLFDATKLFDTRRLDVKGMLWRGGPRTSVFIDAPVPAASPPVESCGDSRP